jgi:hypothetical protein
LAGALVVLLSGCTAAPTPEQETASPIPETSPSPAPSAAQSERPQSVFDIDCAEISETLSAFTGDPADAARETLGFVSAPNWYPGPAQLMAPRAGGVACSYDGEMREDGRETGWSVMIIPRAQSTIDALAAEGYSDQTTECHEGGCVLFARNGDALLSGVIAASGVTPDDSDEVSAFTQVLVDQAAASQEPEFTVAPSPLAGAECTDLLQPEQIGTLWGVEAEVSDQFGGWSVPTEVYIVVNGAALCSYSSNAGSYESDLYVVITDLPAGSWALPHDDARAEITIAGADAAWAGTDAMHEGRPFIDLEVDGDWIRLTGFSQAPERELAAVAETVAENLAVLD